MKKTHCVRCLLYIRDRNLNQNFESKKFCPSSFECTLLPCKLSPPQDQIQMDLQRHLIVIYIIHVCVQQKSYDSSNGVKQISVHFVV